MRVRELVALLACAGTILATAPPVHAGTPPDLSVVTDERDCTEVGYIRGGSPAAVDALVPDRYGPAFLAGTAPRVRLLVNEVTCRHVDLAGHPASQRPTTTMILSASYQTVDGQPRAGNYVLSYATTNAVVAAQYRRVGWPVVLLDQELTALTTETLPGGETEATWTVVGGGWDHVTRLRAAEPVTAPESSTATYSYDVSPERRLTLTYGNLFAVTNGTIDADLTATPLAPVAFLPPVLVGFFGTYVRGGWTATLSSSG